jgi:hypothetical protein
MRHHAVSALGKPRRQPIPLDFLQGRNRDYASAIATGINPLVVSYGFEDYERLIDGFGIPKELVSKTPRELNERLCHALGLIPSF